MADAVRGVCNEARTLIEALAGLVDVPIQVDGGVGRDNVETLHAAGASLFIAGSAIFGAPDPAVPRSTTPAPATSSTGILASECSRTL